MSIVRDGNGDIYVAGLVFAPSPVVVVSCYDTVGLLKFRKTSELTSSDVPASIHGATIYSGSLYFVATLDSSTTRVYRFNPDTQVFTFFTVTSGAADVYATTFKTSIFGTYCIAGTRQSDNASVIQVRNTSTNALQRQVVLPIHEFSAIHGPVGGFYYVVSTTASGPRLATVHRVSVSSDSSYSAPIPDVAGRSMTALTADLTLFYIRDYNDGVTGYNLFVVPFKIPTLSFASSWEEVSPVNSRIASVSPLGTNSVLILLLNRYLAISNNGGLLFDNNYPNIATISSAASVIENDGAVVGLLNAFSDRQLLRFSPSGSVLNRTPVDVPDCTFHEATIDGAGVARVTYSPTSEPYESQKWLVCVSQAALDLPGPFTVGGSNLTATLSLGGPAPTGGATFELFSNNAAAVVPATATVPAGQTSVNFTINTSAVAANAKPIINARYLGVVLQKSFDLAAPLIQNVTATPQSQYGGVNIAGTVQLTGPAPAGGKTVTLTSSNTARATVPVNVTVPAGATSANFAITTVPTLVNASSVITATTGAVSKTRFIAIVAPVFQTATLTNTSIIGGTSTTMTLTIGTPAPSGYTVTLLSGASTLVQIPSSFAVPAGNTTVNVPVLSSPVSASVPITLVAYRGPYIKTMTLTLTP